MKKFPQYKFLQELFLRAPYYSFAGYDLDRLQQVLSDEGFRNGLFLASPAFYKVLKEKDFDLQRLTEKEKHSVSKYYNRMCFRPTPFGSFASFTLLTWGDGETVKLAGDDGTFLHLLPDAKLAAQTIASTWVTGDDDLLIRNPTVYLVGREFRFVKSLVDASGHYRFSLDAVMVDAFYTALFKLFEQPVQKNELLLWIAQTSGCSDTDAKDFLDFLITEQILYHPETGHIIGKYPNSHDCEPCAQSRSMYQPVTVKISASLAATAGEAARALKLPEPDDSTNYFYAGLERSLHSGGPGDQDQSDISLAVELLRRLATPYSSILLKKFIADFQTRFDREKVPILLALDPDSGIAYGNFGISGLAKGFEDIRIHEFSEKKEPVEWTKLHSWLFRLLGAAREEGSFSPLVLTEAHLKEIEAIIDPGLAPPTVAVMFRKTADQLLIEYAGGAAAVGLIGRFSVFSEAVAALCHKLAKHEAASHPDIIFADIGQLSDEHTDNINRRLQVYPYEIPLNVFSVLSEAEQLKPEDLTLCIRDGQLILNSTKFRKRVIPRLASAYNYKHNELAIFQLLGDLQYQGLQANLNFNLEHFFPGLNFYPRVVFGRVIVSLARWHFAETDITRLQAATGGDPLSRLRDFRQRFGLPQNVSIGKFDQQLVFDLSNRQEANFFLKCIKGFESLVVTEYLMPDRSVKIRHKSFTGQFISFLHHDEKIFHWEPITETPEVNNAARSFLPGSNWLYIKIYCTPASADRILSTVVIPVVRKNQQDIRKWFFIRYTDGGYHLRLRFLLPEAQVGTILIELKNQLTTSGYDSLVKNYQADIYKREMERYAGVIELVEEFFHASSELIVQFLELADDENRIVTPFFMGLYSAWRLVTCFTNDISALKEFTGGMAEGFIRKFTSNKQLKRDMDLKYRSMRADVNALLEGPVPVPTLTPAFLDLINTATAIANKTAEDQPERWGGLLADLVHMQLNRTFPVKQRTHEFMVYYFLNKYAISREARIYKGS